MRYKLMMFVIIASCCLAACGNRSSQPQQSAINYGSAELETLIKNNCMSCHGGELQGRMGPSLRKIGGELSKEDLYEIISGGKRGMPAFDKRLDESEIDKIASWLSQQK